MPEDPYTTAHAFVPNTFLMSRQQVREFNLVIPYIMSQNEGVKSVVKHGFLESKSWY